jgi:methionine synthase II (cobalamin-independent)
MQRTQPPFRADQVSSLLRTPALKEARTRHAAVAISAAELRVTEDHEIRKPIESQESVGFRAVTDGEYRPSYWRFDLLEQLRGVERVQTEHGVQFQRGVGSACKGLPPLEAEKSADLDQSCLSPQCGFAFTERETFFGSSAVGQAAHRC